MSYEGGVKRLQERADDPRNMTKRSNSFSTFATAVPDATARSVPRELRKLETFFTLEHTRLPKNPTLIHEVTTGEELSSQLSFNWLLEERIATTCELIEKVELRAPSNVTDGTKAIFSTIGANSIGIDDGGIMSMEPDTQPSTPFDLATENTFDLLFGGGDEEDAFGGVLADFEDPVALLFGASSPVHPPSPQLRDLVRFERTHNRLDYSDGLSSDVGNVENMQVSSDWGPVSAIRDGNVSSTSVSLAVPPSASALTREGLFVTVSRADALGAASLGMAGIQSGSFGMKEMSLTDLDEGPVQALAVDEDRSFLFVSSGRYINGYDLNDPSRGIMFRLASERSALAPLLMCGNSLFSAVGATLNRWDIEEVEATSTSDTSSQMEFESISSYSEGDSSPQMSAPESDFFSDRFTSDLHNRLAVAFCRVCTNRMSQVDLEGASGRKCSECLVSVCPDCIHVYKLTSLGETDTRPICNGCMPTIRRRILAKQQSARMLQLSDGKTILHSRHNSIYNHRTKPIAPRVRQELGAGRATPSVERSISLLKADYSCRDSVVVAFAGRPCALSWNAAEGFASRWFVGHTANITSMDTVSSLPNTVATGSRDHSCKIWDSRLRQAGLTLQAHTGSVTALQLVQFPAATFCITSGADECVKVWDLRKQVPMYELSTGNNIIQDMHWNHKTSSLVCASFLPPGRVQETSQWPYNAVHPSDHYPRAWNAGTHQMLQYDFVSLM